MVYTKSLASKIHSLGDGGGNNRVSSVNQTKPTSDLFRRGSLIFQFLAHGSRC